MQLLLLRLLLLYPSFIPLLQQQNLLLAVTHVR
jgi:hypothetical protein